MSEYKVDLPLWCTAYVQADSRDAALAKLIAMFGAARKVPGQGGTGGTVQFNQDDAPVQTDDIDVTLCPVATAYGFDARIVECDEEENPFHPESPEGRAWDAGDRSFVK